MGDMKCSQYLPICLMTLGQGPHSYMTKISLVLHTWQCLRNVYPSADHSSSELLATRRSRWTCASYPERLAGGHSQPPSGCLSISYCNNSVNISLFPEWALHCLINNYRNLLGLPVWNEWGLIKCCSLLFIFIASLLIIPGWLSSLVVKVLDSRSRGRKLDSRQPWRCQAATLSKSFTTICFRHQVA